jgi:5-methylcytosine-specific restriction protein A
LLKNYGLYKVTDTAILDKILNNAEFKKKNSKGNRMSDALNHFKGYIEQIRDKELQAELLKEEIEFERYLNESPVDISRRKKEDNPKLNLITEQ